MDASIVPSTAPLPTWIPISSSWPAVMAGVVVLLGYLYRWTQPRPLPGIPYNKGIGWAGDLPEIVALGHKGKGIRFWFGEQAIRHNSPITQVFLQPFGKPTVVICDHREAYDIAIRRNKDFDRITTQSQNPFRAVLPNHSISMMQSDPRYKGNKELTKDLMTPAFLNDVSAPSIYNKALSLVDLWAYKTDIVQGRSFRASQDIHNGALDMILAVAFGENHDYCSTLKIQLDYLVASNHTVYTVPSEPYTPVVFPSVEAEPSIKALQAVAESIDFGLRNSFLQSWHYKTQLQKAFARKKEFITSEINKAVERLEATGNDDNLKSQRCAMDHMILREMNAARKAGRQPELHTPQIHDELFGYLIGGHDTTSTTLAWMIKFLADNPVVQSTLRRQLHAAYATAFQEKRQPLCYEITKTPAPYLDAFLEEGLRLRSALPIMSRSAVADTHIFGYHIPKDTPLLIYVQGPGYTSRPLPITENLRSETSQATKDRVGEWDKATVHELRPERWLRARDEVEDGEFGRIEFNAQSGPFLAYGGGVRGCFGRRLGYLELRIVIALLVWNFDFLACPPELSTYDAVEALTTTPKDCYVRLRRV